MWLLPKAVVAVIELTACVVTVGATPSLVKETWLPYTVPALLVA